MSNVIWGISGFLLITGILSIGAGVLSQRILKKKEEYQGNAVGTVIDIVMDEADEEGKGRGIREYFYPILGYYAHGKLQKSRYKVGSYPCKYKLNDKINIKFKEDSPEEFIVAVKDRANKLSSILYIVGIILCIIAEILFVVYIKK